MSTLLTVPTCCGETGSRFIVDCDFFILNTLTVFIFKQTFQGNRDQLSVQTHPINPAIYGRYVRIIPRGWRSHISMRLELYASPWSKLSSKHNFHVIAREKQDQDRRTCISFKRMWNYPPLWEKLVVVEHVKWPNSRNTSVANDYRDITHFILSRIFFLLESARLSRE